MCSRILGKCNGAAAVTAAEDQITQENLLFTQQYLKIHSGPRASTVSGLCDIHDKMGRDKQFVRAGFITPAARYIEAQERTLSCSHA